MFLLFRRFPVNGALEAALIQRRDDSQDDPQVEHDFPDQPPNNTAIAPDGQNSTSIPLAEVPATTIIAAAAAATPSTTPLAIATSIASQATTGPSNPSSKQLGSAIGASVGVPIGVIIILTVFLVGLWQWKKQRGKLGAIRYRRELRRQSKNGSDPSQAGKPVGSEVEVNENTKDVEAGIFRKNSTHEPPNLPTAKPLSKGVDIFAASLAAKSSVAAMEAMNEAKKIKNKQEVVKSRENISELPHVPVGPSTRKKSNSSDHPPLAQLRRHQFDDPQDPKKDSFDMSNQPLSPRLALPTQLDVPDPPIAPLEVMVALRGSTPTNPSRSPPPAQRQPTEFNQTSTPAHGHQNPQPLASLNPQPVTKSYSQRQAHSRSRSRSQPRPYPEPVVEEWSLEEVALPEPQLQKPPKQEPASQSPPTRTHLHSKSSANADLIRKARRLQATQAADMYSSSDDESISALPPLPAPEPASSSAASSPRQQRSNPLLRPSLRGMLSSTRHSHSRSDTDATTPAVLRRSNSKDSNRTTSSQQYPPKSAGGPERSESPASLRSNASPAFLVHAELQRHAQERELWEQRRAIGENYGRLMRDWDAGPMRRLGDGKDFSGPESSEQQLQMLLEQQRKQQQKKQARVDSREPPNQAKGRQEPEKQGTVRVPVLAGPGSKGKTIVVDRRSEEPKKEDQE
jgi:hypothetical protein